MKVFYEWIRRVSRCFSPPPAALTIRQRREELRRLTRSPFLR